MFVLVGCCVVALFVVRRDCCCLGFKLVWFVVCSLLCVRCFVFVVGCCSLLRCVGCLFVIVACDVLFVDGCLRFDVGCWSVFLVCCLCVVCHLLL